MPAVKLQALKLYLNALNVTFLFSAEVRAHSTTIVVMWLQWPSLSVPAYRTDPEQVKDYLCWLQQRSRTASQTYFKHTVYGCASCLKQKDCLTIICIFLLLTVQKNCPLSLAGRRYGPCYIRRNCWSIGYHWTAVWLWAALYGGS